MECIDLDLPLKTSETTEQKISDEQEDHEKDEKEESESKNEPNQEKPMNSIPTPMSSIPYPFPPQMSYFSSMPPNASYP